MAPRAVSRHQRKRSCKTSQQKQSDPSVCIRFIKFVFGKDCNKFVPLPPEFAPKVKHLVSKNVHIKDECGGQWSVTLDQRHDGSLALQTGWRKFFLDHDLKVGDFLLFSYKGDHFLVSVFGRSAMERFDFSNEMHPRSKRSRRDFETDSPSKLLQNYNMNTKDSSNSDSSVGSGTKLRNSPTGLVEEKAEFEGLQHPPPSIGMVDTDCIIIDRNDFHRGEDVSILYDLSKFEMGNMSNHSNKFDEGINSKFDCSSNRIADQSKTDGGDTEIPEIHMNLVGRNSGDAFTGNLNKDLNTGLLPKGTKISKQCKTVGNGRELADEINGSSVEILNSKTEKDLVSKRSCIGITGNENMMKVDGRETTVLNIDSPNVDSGHCLSDYFCSNSTEYRGMGKNMADSKFQRVGSNIVRKESDEQNRDFNSSFSNTLPKNPIGKQNIKEDLKEKLEGAGSTLLSCGKRSIKEELVEKLEGAGSSLLTCVKRRNTDGTQDQVFPVAVKAEPNLPLDTSSCLSPFTAEVQSLHYQEVAIPLPSFPRCREKGRGRVIYLKDSLRRTWPVLQADRYPVVALTSNWRKFCTYNNIKAGNKCTFKADEDTPHCCRVEIDRNM